jgi:hypothetical protein
MARARWVRPARAATDQAELCVTPDSRMQTAFPSSRDLAGIKSQRRRRTPSVNDRWALVACVCRGQRAPREASAPLESRSRRAAGWDRRVLAIVPALHATGMPWGASRFS